MVIFKITMIWLNFKNGQHHQTCKKSPGIETGRQSPSLHRHRPPRRTLRTRRRTEKRPGRADFLPGAVVPYLQHAPQSAARETAGDLQTGRHGRGRFT